MNVVFSLFKIKYCIIILLQEMFVMMLETVTNLISLVFLFFFINIFFQSLCLSNKPNKPLTLTGVFCKKMEDFEFSLGDPIIIKFLFSENKNKALIPIKILTKKAIIF